jgi:hypothetical protein
MSNVTPELTQLRRKKNYSSHPPNPCLTLDERSFLGINFPALIFSVYSRGPGNKAHR